MEKQRVLETIANYAGDYILGIDEVGVGSLAGPVTVAAVVVPKDWKHKKVKDSKKLTPNQRAEADSIVRKDALTYCIYSASNDDVDAEGIKAVVSRLTFKCARSLLHYYPEALVVQDGDDGVPLSGLTNNVVWCAKADELVPAVAAASVLAKELRDNFMISASYTYAGYGFGTNMGYGTKEHNLALRELGPSPLHRRSYKTVF